MSFENPKVVIAGAGGMGALFGSILKDGGLDVTLVDTDAGHVAAICRDGLQITGFGGERTLAINATTDAGTIDAADVVLFQCKAHGSRDAARSVHHLVRGGAVCISFQNGLGNEEVIAGQVGAGNVLGGLTAMAGAMLGPGRVRDFSRVPSYLGEMDGGVSERARQIASAFTAAGLETHASENIRLDIWKKLLGNIAFSAMSGVTDLSTAACLRVPQLQQTSLRAQDEALAVAASLGIELDRGEVVKGLELISKEGGTGDNKSSLCGDILNRRPTEIDFIYGTVIAQAREAGISTPTLDTLVSIVKGLESHYLETGT